MIGFTYHIPSGQLIARLQGDSITHYARPDNDVGVVETGPEVTPQSHFVNTSGVLEARSTIAPSLSKLEIVADGQDSSTVSSVGPWVLVNGVFTATSGGTLVITSDRPKRITIKGAGSLSFDLSLIAKTPTNAAAMDAAIDIIRAAPTPEERRALFEAALDALR